MYIKIIFYLLIISATYGCGKHDPEPLHHDDDSIPVASMNFISPVTGSVYAYGDSILIMGTAISTTDFHGYELFINKVNGSELYYSGFIHAHNDTLAIHSKWKNTNIGTADLEVVISLLLDHDGHTLVKKVLIRSQ